MASANQLAQAMGKLNMSNESTIANPQPTPTCESTAHPAQSYPRRQPHHELLFKFPALDLLCAGEQPFMPDPHMFEFRPAPRREDFGLDSYPLHVFHYMDPNLSPPKNVKALGTSTVASSVFELIDALCTSPGYTQISICPVQQHSGIAIRMGLKRASAEGQDSNAIWQLTPSDFQALLSVQERPWIQLLNDVFFRKTALTYFIASRTLWLQNPALWRYDTENCAGKWNSRTARSPVTLFKNRLKVAGKKRSVATENFNTNGGTCRAELPCGHRLTLRKADIEGLTDENCIDMTCPECWDEILQGVEREEARMFVQEAECTDVAAMADGWAELGWDDLSETVVTFDSKALLMALHSAARSLKAPASVASNYLCPVQMEETSTALEALEAWLSAQAKTIQKSPRQLVEDLSGLAQKALRVTSAEPGTVPTPPGWQDFLILCLTRAVKFAYQRRCKKAGRKHEGTHLHSSDGLVYWQDLEAAAMAKLENGLGGLALGGKR